MKAPAATRSDLERWLATQRERVDRTLPRHLPARHTLAASVHDAMADALLSPGKRIRPILALAIAEIYRVDPDRVLTTACAIEMVHASSLILDDLPCMDAAETRRGRPACHVVHGEATAILAAVGLLNHAFALIAGELDPAGRGRAGARAVRRIAAAIGTEGVIGGQAADLDLARTADTGRGLETDLRTLEYVHSHKTGSLFIATVELAAAQCGATAGETTALSRYAKNLGLAFQITDDLIDATGVASVAGKPVRSAPGKPDFVTLCGADGARTLAGELIDAAVSALSPFARRGRRLEGIARFVAARDR